MLRLTNAFKSLSLSGEAFAANYNNLQSVRWRRKPRWLPTAKSKLYKVPARPVIPEDEAAELRRLYNIYRTQVKSLKRYLDRSYNLRYEQSVDVNVQMKLFEEDFERCNKINDEWNAERKLVRDQRVAESLQQQIEDAKQRLEIRTKIWEERRLASEEIIRREKETAKSFITPDKLEQAIEEAIANPIDHNYAIDLEGNKIEGRSTKPNADVKVQASVKQ